MKSLLLAWFSFALIFSASECLSQGREWTMALQSRLTIEGFYDGKADGVVGPATRRAISQYSAARGVADDIVSVSDAIVAKARKSERSDPTSYQIQSARKLVGGTLRDAESARFRGEAAFLGPNFILICGEVNAKNAYNAYVGYQAYAVTFSTDTLSMDGVPPGEPGLFPIASELEAFTDEMCAMGISTGAVVMSKFPTNN